MNPKGKAIIFSAPSGAGKSTLVRAMLERDLPLAFSISATSRAPRGDERDGVEYHFLSPEAFRSAIESGELLEWEEVYSNQFYGTLKTELDRIWDSGNAALFDVDVYGGITLKQKLGDKALSIFVKPPSIAVLEERLRARKTEDEAKIRLRIDKAEEELAKREHFDVVILNDQLESAVEQTFVSIVEFLES